MSRLSMNVGRWRRLLLFATGLAGFGALATSAPVLTLAQRAQQSDRVVVAKVSGTREQPLHCAGTPGCAGALTVATFTVAEDLKGKGPSVVEVAVPAHADVPGGPRFENGERAIVFLRCFDSPELKAARAKLGDTVAPGAQRCALYGFADAKLAIVRQGATDVVLVPAGRGTVATRRLDELKSELRAAGREVRAGTANTPVMSAAPRSLARPVTIDARDGRVPAPTPRGAQR